MTLQQLQNLKPISTDGMVLLDKSALDAVQELCEDLQAMPAILKAEVNFAKNGIAYDGDEVLARLRKKYVKII